jgi:ubiquitin carboxyl-terminal hydrolase 34
VENVVSSDTSLDSLFPPGKFFQAKYAAQALRAKLEDQLRKVSFLGQPLRLAYADSDQSTLDDDFLSNSIRLLDKALLNPELVNNKTFASQGVQLAAVLVDVLLQFLRGKNQRTISSSTSGSNLLQNVLLPIFLRNISRMKVFSRTGLWRYCR